MKNTTTSKRPKDINQLAKFIVEQATEDKPVKVKVKKTEGKNK
jgi:hypothetical protein